MSELRASWHATGVNLCHRREDVPPAVVLRQMRRMVDGESRLPGVPVICGDYYGAQREEAAMRSDGESDFPVSRRVAAEGAGAVSHLLNTVLLQSHSQPQPATC